MKGEIPQPETLNDECEQLFRQQEMRDVVCLHLDIVAILHKALD